MDLSHWQTENKFTLKEAASLIAGIDPLGSHKPEHASDARFALALRQLDDDYRYEANRLIDAVLHHYHPEDAPNHRLQTISWRTKALDGIRSINYESARADVLSDSPFTGINSASDVEDLCYPVDAQKFRREEIARWCAIRGWTSKFDFANKGQDSRWSEDNEGGGQSTPPFNELEIAAPKLPHARTEKNFLALIAAMAIDKYDFDPNAERIDTASNLSAMLGAKGFSLTAQSIRGYLKEGAGHLNVRKIK